MQAANNASISYQRNCFDQVLTETSPDRGATAYTYDAAGNLCTQLGARGVATPHTWTR